MCPTSKSTPRSSTPPSASQSPRRRGTTFRSLPDLRVRLADRSLRQTNPVLGVVAGCSNWHGAGDRLPGPRSGRPRPCPPSVRLRRRRSGTARRSGWWSRASGGVLTPSAGAPYRLESLEANTWRTGSGPHPGRGDHGRRAPTPGRRRAPSRRRRQRGHRTGGPASPNSSTASTRRSAPWASPSPSTPGPRSIAQAADSLTATSGTAMPGSGSNSSASSTT